MLPAFPPSSPSSQRPSDTMPTATAVRSGLDATITAIDNTGSGVAQGSAGISVVAFLSALSTSLVIFHIQMILFLLLRNKAMQILYGPYLLPRCTHSC